MKALGKSLLISFFAVVLVHSAMAGVPSVKNCKPVIQVGWEQSKNEPCYGHMAGYLAGVVAANIEVRGRTDLAREFAEGAVLSNFEKRAFSTRGASYVKRHNRTANTEACYLRGAELENNIVWNADRFAYTERQRMAMEKSIKRKIGRGSNC